MAALRFVRNLRPDLEKSHIAQDGSVLYGCDGFNYTIERYKA